MLRDPSLTLLHISPPESHPAELGDFQRQFLLTSQLSWASGLLIRLVNTTRTAGGRDSPYAASHPLPSIPAPSPVLLFSVLEHLSLFAACHPPCAEVSLRLGSLPAACLCPAPL